MSDWCEAKNEAEPVRWVTVFGDIFAAVLSPLVSTTFFFSVCLPPVAATGVFLWSLTHSGVYLWALLSIIPAVLITHIALICCLICLYRNWYDTDAKINWTRLSPFSHIIQLCTWNQILFFFFFFFPPLQHQMWQSQGFDSDTNKSSQVKSILFV